MSFTCSVVNVRRPRIDVQHFFGLFSELYVAEEKEDAHEEADGADGDVGDAEERVPPAEQRRRGDDHTLGAAELLHPKSLRKFNRCQYANACELYLNATYCSRC